MSEPIVGTQEIGIDETGPEWLVTLLNPSDKGWFALDLRDISGVQWFPAATRPVPIPGLPDLRDAYIALSNGRGSIYFDIDEPGALRIRKLWLAVRSRMEHLP